MFPPDDRFRALDTLDGQAFELALKELFELLGYDVQLTPRFDKGADLILTSDGVKTAVQAKRSSSAVGIAGIRQLVDGARRYDCDRGLVVTNSFFTHQARECAGEWGVELWDRSTLSDYLEGEPPEIDQSRCAECGAKVSPGVTRWCLDHTDWYLGNVFCPRHQSRKSRAA